MELWTNPDCSRYLEDPPTREELEALLAKGLTLQELSRDPQADLDELLKDPSKLQRPIAILGDRAIIARPPERILDLLP